MFSVLVKLVLELVRLLREIWSGRLEKAVELLLCREMERVGDSIDLESTVRWFPGNSNLRGSLPSTCDE